MGAPAIMYFSTAVSRIARVAMLAMALASRPACAEAQWPVIALPKSAIPYSIGEHLIVAGLPMRLQGFVSTATPISIASWFRRSLGTPLMENVVARKLVLGRPYGEYFVSIQLEAVGGGTRGLISVAHLKAGYEAQSETKSSMERLLARLPSGSRLVSDISSVDRGKLARHLVISNSYHEEVNRNRLTAMMRDDGLVLEQDAQVADEAARTMSASTNNGRAMFFKGPRKEAVAVILMNAAGQTTVILNTVTEIERLK